MAAKAPAVLPRGLWPGSAPPRSTLNHRGVGEGSLATARRSRGGRSSMLGLADQTAFITPADITPADTAAAQSATLSWGGQAGDENRRCGLGWRAVPAFSKSGFTESGDRRRGVQATLAMRVLVRLGWTALTVIAANIVYALSHNLFDANHLAENIVRGKAQRIALRMAASVGADQVDREEAVPEPDGVSFRVIDPNRTILAERNAALWKSLDAQRAKSAQCGLPGLPRDHGREGLHLGRCPAPDRRAAGSG